MKTHRCFFEFLDILRTCMTTNTTPGSCPACSPWNNWTMFKIVPATHAARLDMNVLLNALYELIANY